MAKKVTIGDSLRKLDRLIERYEMKAEGKKLFIIHREISKKKRNAKNI
tara:strand:- start:774 stop:917 length:144 start_codon:yes stop_codon:yes gene_type:complete